MIKNVSSYMNCDKLMAELMFTWNTRNKKQLCATTTMKKTKTNMFAKSLTMYI